MLKEREGRSLPRDVVEEESEERKEGRLPPWKGRGLIEPLASVSPSSLLRQGVPSSPSSIPPQSLSLLHLLVQSPAHSPSLDEKKRKGKKEDGEGR